MAAQIPPSKGEIGRAEVGALFAARAEWEGAVAREQGGARRGSKGGWEGGGSGAEDTPGDQAGAEGGEGGAVLAAVVWLRGAAEELEREPEEERAVLSFLSEI